MNEPVLVQIIAAPIACEDGIKDTWHEVARWAENQLAGRFGESVRLEYYDLFDPECPPIPTEAQLPLVMVNQDVVISGGKISMPVIRRKVESLLEASIA